MDAFLNKRKQEPLKTLFDDNVNSSAGMGDADSSAVATPPQKLKNSFAVEKIYQKKSQLEHILLRPDTYIGSVEHVTEAMWVYDADNKAMVKRDITYVPGLFKIFDEILVNAADNKQRDKKMNCIKITISPETNEISIYNNGKGIPVVEHKGEKMFVPSLIFGHLLTSSNYNDDEKKVTGGRNGYGAKLCNIFSTEFTVVTACKTSKGHFTQTWENNMSKTREPKVKPFAGEDFTKITFKPDLKKFKMQSLDKDIVSLFSRRAFDVAGSTRGVKVYLNGEHLPIKTFKEYVDQYVGNKVDEQGNPVKVVYESVNDRWEIAVTMSDHGYQQVSFVNSIATTKGGRHVDYVTDHVVSKIIDVIKKKNKGGVNIKPFQIKSHMWVFVNCLIENPTFDSQTKENMTLQYKSFGSKCNISDKFITHVQKCGVVESVLTWMKFKQQSQLDSKCYKSKLSKLRGIPKLEDANLAGTKNSNECTLILTEGDSAKTLAVSGLGVIGRDKYGVFPLRGKMLNVREATHKQILENAEINNIIKIVGLQYKKKYQTVDDLKSLRYGHIMIMTDQDQDGSHIKGLLINFIHHNWPELIRLPFLEEFITPIVKATKGGQEKSFYSIPEFEEWKRATDSYNTWRIKYYKGLGTSTAKEAREYFNDMIRHRIKFKYSGTQDDNSIQLAFSKKMVEQRKEWLTNGMEERKQRRELGLSEVYLYGKETKDVTFQDFVNKELILFSNMDNERSIPSLMDGLKPGQRKVIFTCLKRNDKKEIKVAQLAGSVGEHSAYHHGEQSLMTTIINLAQNFVGSNNINLLQPIGQFGTRLQGGKDAASPRYIFTMLSPLAKHIFNQNDNPLLSFLTEDNQKIEPEYYVPIIPMVLVNGAEGIGTGWMTKIPNYNPREIVENIKRILLGEEVQPMIPWFKNFRGTIEQVDHQRFVVSGEVSVVTDKNIEITELPIRTWTQAYKESVLEPMLHGNDKIGAMITDYKEYHTDTTVRFVVSVTDERMNKCEEEGFHKAFKLQTTMTTTSMVLFDHNGCLRRYDNVDEILREFYEVRLSFYKKRKLYLEGILQAESNRLSNQARFILEKIEGKIVIENRKKVEVIADLVKRGYDFDPVKAWKKQQDRERLLEEEAEEDSDSEKEDEDSGQDFNYLMGMHLWSLTREQKDELLKQRDKKQAELVVLQSKSPPDLWREDLDAFLNELDLVEKKEREDEELGLSGKPTKVGKPAAGASRQAKKPKMTKAETRPSMHGRRIEPRIDAELKRRVEKAAATAAGLGAKRGRKKASLEENGADSDGEPKPLFERIKSSPGEKTTKGPKKGLKQATLNFSSSNSSRSSPAKKRKAPKKNPWSSSEGSEDDISDFSDVELRNTLSKLPHEGPPKRATATKARYKFESDSSVIMSDDEREAPPQPNKGGRTGAAAAKKDDSGSESGDDSPIESTPPPPAKSKTSSSTTQQQKSTGNNNSTATATSKVKDAENSESDGEKDNSKSDHKDDDRMGGADSDSGDNVKTKVAAKKPSSNNAVKKNATSDKKDGKKKSLFDSLISDKGDSKTTTKKAAAAVAAAATNNDEEEDDDDIDEEDDAKSDESDAEFVQDEDDEDEEELASKKPPKKRGRKKATSDPSDEDEFVPQAKKKSTAARRPALRKRKGGSAAESDESATRDKSKKTKRKKKGAESDDSERMESSMSQRSRSARSRAPVKYNFGDDSDVDDY